MAMGALAPVCPWIPEDDFLLKNAMEAGASLESLAEGAVRFSRRFTIQELQNRWHALLYDPVVSAEASVCMIEDEHPDSSLPSKPSSVEDSKETNCVSEKRKAESACSQYYTTRKRICNKPFDSMDPNYIVGPGHNNCKENGEEPYPATCMLADPISSHSVIGDSNIDITDHAFPEFGTESIAAATNIGVSPDACYTGFHSSVQGDLDVPQNNMHTQMPWSFGENIPFAMSYSVVEEMAQPKKVPVSNMFKAHHLDAKPLVISEQGLGNMGNVCSRFRRSQGFDSPISDCGALLHNLECTSLLPPMPTWSLIEGVSALSISDTSGYDVLSDSKLKNQMLCDNPCSADYLAELSDALLDFTNEEELLFMDGDGKDGIEKSYIDGFSSLLLDSPSGNMPNIVASEGAMTPDNCSSKSQMLTCASAVNLQFPELRDGVICCLLNTEDTEIPSNDDVFLAYRMPSPSLLSASQFKFYEANNPTSSSVNSFSDHEKANAGCVSLMKRDWKIPGQSHFSPQMRGSLFIPGKATSHLVGDHEGKFEFPNNGHEHLALRFASMSCQDASKISVDGTTHILPALLKGDATEIKRANHLNYSADSYFGTPVSAFDSLMSYPKANAISCKQEVDANARNQQAHAELGSVRMTVPDLFVNHSPEDQIELPADFDADIPDFSDVEAMILEMDLSPDDQGLYSSCEVSRYQQEDSKRAIVRLEQAAHSCVQRAIASQGALAVLYGRHSKFDIKKSVVLLGRTTKDFEVDIDLTRDGCTNKISRRQAIIMMDQSGSFFLKNLGKCSISLNDKEIAPKQSASLTSGCSIEVRGMPFVFETNQNCVKQYADSLTKESQTQNQQV